MTEESAVPTYTINGLEYNINPTPPLTTKTTTVGGLLSAYNHGVGRDILREIYDIKILLDDNSMNKEDIEILINYRKKLLDKLKTL